MTNRFLRVEGVNLENVLADTEQLSVIRGGSLLLLKAPEDIRDRFALTPVSTGASSGLFRLPVDADPVETVRQVRDYLRDHEQYRHFTFVVDYAEQVETDYVGVREALLAKNRFRQLQQPTISPTETNEGVAAPCEYDNLRPAAGTIEVKRDEGLVKRQVSSSVKQRFEFGRTQKQKIYGDIAGKEVTAEYAMDLHEIAHNPDYPQLNDKIAVIYLDGNQFGEIQRSRCVTEELHEEFDRTVKKNRAEFLRGLLDKHRDNPDFQTDDGRLRMELLLWGGDELCLVVPAWMGFQCLCDFYGSSRDWVFDTGAASMHPAVPLTHAGGIVFCHVKTPISTLRELAEALAESVKQHEQVGDLYRCLVLESVDLPDVNLSDIWHARYRTLGEPPPLPSLADARWLDLRQPIEELQTLVPKRQAYMIAHAAIVSGADDGNSTFAEHKHRLREVLGENSFTRVEEGMVELFAEVTDDRWRWVYLLELWDYLLPGKVEASP